MANTWSPIPGPSYPNTPNAFNTVFNNLARKVLKGVVTQQAPLLSPAVQCLLRNKEVMPGKPGQSFFEFNALPLNPYNPLQQTDWKYGFNLTDSVESNPVPARCNDAKYIATTTIARGKMNLLQDNPNTFFNEIAVEIGQLYQNVLQQLSVMLTGYTTATDYSQFYGLQNIIDDTTQTGVQVLEEVNRGTYPWFNAYVLNPATFTYNNTQLPVYQQFIAAQIWYDKQVNGSVAPFRFGFCSHSTLSYLVFSMTRDANNSSIERILNLDGSREYNIQYVRVGNILLFPDPLIPAGQVFFFHPSDVKLILNRYDAFVSKIIDATFIGYYGAQALILLIGGQLVCKRPSATLRLINMPVLGGM